MYTILATELRQAPLVPVIVVDDAAQADDLALALLAGGLSFAEVTLRTPQALASISRMASHPALKVGAGTVLTPQDVDQSVDAGAAFLVSPGYNDDVVNAAFRRGVPIIPGAASASDLMRASRDHLKLVKFFPAEAAGGLPLLQSLSDPFPSISFLATGGVSEQRLTSYLAAPFVAGVGASWLSPRRMIKEGEFDKIRSIVERAVSHANSLRSGG